uniref:Uncharacterized protein n=1 Tax=Lepeophtheirus salmonis TaxID=72036 RepID=A0A0K2UT56_LEPSM
MYLINASLKSFLFLQILLIKSQPLDSISLTSILSLFLINLTKSIVRFNEKSGILCIISSDIAPRR